ncbi:uncharacterized protein LOC126328047 [Schistocerca gregaria]|uniref:uncharacterized protein LOC126328047 n=1 Tax=Schistocerca gregaria TaxID=7010 RepID=UPI00211EA037|nr:uncharacterized protein LOC126328047 [Schistocerca gregaria]
MEQHEHILLRPDMYIGSTRRVTEELWVWDEAEGMMVHRAVTYSPGLYKIFDEILVNAADNYQRDRKMKFIKVDIERESGMIRVHNDGNGIPIEVHKKHQKYVPELIFGDLLTGSSFDDTQQKVTGGRNGLGAKLANIYSSRFIVETCCQRRLFRQEFRRNMLERERPQVSETSQADFTRVTFCPDYERFDGMGGLDEDILALFRKRVYDVAGCNAKLSVYLNGRLLGLKSFKDYVGLYFREEARPEIVGPDVVVDREGRKRWEFDSQTKETLKSTQSQWGTKPELTDGFLNRVATKSGVVEQVLLWNQGRSEKVLKTTTMKKRGRLGISKLTEANQAATSKSARCTLIITEGDSAKGLALAGLSVVGRDYYGIFPLRGKLLNVRDAPMSQVIKNEELNMIKQAMGLQHDKAYESLSGLRYGHIMVMTDQDHDGSHIKGLFINFVHHYWPSLLRIPGFLTEFITPIVKATKGDQTVAFFTMPQYQEWCANRNLKGWKIKYYKGLGTSEPSEMQEYFSDLPRHKKEFCYVGAEDDESIALAFAKGSADQRKEWLANYRPGTHLDQSLTRIPYNEFINKEFILFSLEDCERSIANMVDGFKPGQRKIMFACFKRSLKGEIKIAQLAGYVLEHCAYHHGEMSLYSTIIGMAQNFVGSHNLNLLEPIGNFGSRDQGGKDCAAARYIFTTLSPLTRYIFHPDDDEILSYLEEEGLKIQPSYYCPVVPMVLINGNAGIGTGWSSFVPNYNPMDVVRNLRRLLRNEGLVAMKPWYRGFLGSIEWSEKKRHYVVRGVWRRVDEETIEITELPIGMWTQSYKDFLEAAVGDFASMSDEMVEKKLKLTTSISTSNMHLFDGENRIRKYPTAEEILKAFFGLRLGMYERRKSWLVDRMRKELRYASNRLRFVLAVIEKRLVVTNRKKRAIYKDLVEQGFDPMPKNALMRQVEMARVELLPEGEEGEEGEEVEESEEKGDACMRDYDYLLGMPIWSLTMERVEKLKEECGNKEADLERMMKVHPADLWERDLDAFEEVWRKYEENMRILDEVGVGGCAFRKPSLQSLKASASIGSGEMKRQKEAKLAQLKKLHPCPPHRPREGLPSAREGREEIVVPEVKTDPVVPPAKTKKLEESGKVKVESGEVGGVGRGDEGEV